MPRHCAAIAHGDEVWRLRPLASWAA